MQPLLLRVSRGHSASDDVFVGKLKSCLATEFVFGGLLLAVLTPAARADHFASCRMVKSVSHMRLVEEKSKDELLLLSLLFTECLASQDLKLALFGALEAGDDVLEHLFGLVLKLRR
jgi:hypothetical protein